MMPRPDPFAVQLEVPVAGGTLHVAQAGPPAREAAGVVLAAHGVTASSMTWRSLARQLPDDICLLAPDLRGRGLSAKLPPPYGLESHVDDLIAVLDYAGASSAVLVGHSMGAYILARLAVEHPERALGLVLLDAGLPIPKPVDAEAMLGSAVANAVMRLGITFGSIDQYVEGWRAHPAFAGIWNDDLEAYARYDLVANGTSVRCIASPAAVRTDSEDMVLDDETRRALERVQAPVQLLRAERGLWDERDNPLIPDDELQAFVGSYPAVAVEDVPDTNHYTLVMGDGPGPRRVAAAIERALA